jgi:hypothetical protein
MMKQRRIEDGDDDTYVVHLKSGDVFEAISEFDVAKTLDDGTVVFVRCFKACKPNSRFYYIVQTDMNNVEYTEEPFTHTAWERLLELAGAEPVEDSTATNALFG